MMIPFEEAQAIAQKSVHLLGTERIPFENALYYVLAENIEAQEFFPPFDKSAMDGYACRKEDLNEVLEVIEIIPAGKMPQKTIGIKQCAKIMTGGMLPKGADTVIIVEQCEILDKNHIQYHGKSTASNICYRGEDAEQGEIILLKGTKLKPRHIAVLATLGATQPLVYKQPDIGVLVTGSELVEPQNKPEPSQIRNSNGYSILSQLKEQRLSASYYGIVPDDMELTEKTLFKALNHNNVLIMSGAVSMGDFDFIPQVLEKMGFEILFHGVQVKPAKRLLFAQKDKKWVIGLPGNPVSTYVQMQEFVLPFLDQLMGIQDKIPDIWLPLDSDLSRKKGDRKELVPCKIATNGKLNKVAYNGSAHVNALVAADGLMEIPIGVTQISKDEKVKFIRF